MSVSMGRVLWIAIFCLLITSNVIEGKRKKTKKPEMPVEALTTKPVLPDPSSPHGVTYDGRSMIIRGKRELLFSGSIHYPRSTPEMWPDLLNKAKDGGLNVIQTYVFWNVHEPVQGQFNFSGNYDLVRFLKMIGEHGMYATLRVGPFIQAEWNHGGLPFWLREVPGMTFRSDNPPFKFHMAKYVKMIIDMMRENKLFATDGGPIILAQIENEYNHVQRAFKQGGSNYVQWAAQLALGFKTGIPWVMCKQTDAPDPVINACNGRHCGDTFIGPNRPYKPALWTENWTAQFRTFGDPPSQREAEDIAFSVARFFSKNGSLNNYYMYHGGTNFGRTSAHFTTTRYYDEAPLDEYGMQREPKWSHLKDLHRALNLCNKALLFGRTSVERLAPDTETRIYETTGQCAAFLTNNHTKIPISIKFRGTDYLLPPRSISILPDCKNVVFNTQMVVSQHNSRNFVRSKDANNFKWNMFPEPIPSGQQLPVNNPIPHDLFTLHKDATDYGWYVTSIHLGPRDLPMRPDILPVLRVQNQGHVMLVFVNGEFIGSGHGSHEAQSFMFQKPVKLHTGLNTISLLGMTVGLPDSGAYMERRFAGPRVIMILGLMSGTIDLTANGWGHQVGLHGEKAKLFTREGAKSVKWNHVKGPGPLGPLTWYKTKFGTPEGKDPVAIRMKGMSKGMVWVNGNSIGRYWMSFLSPLGQPTQAEYFIPRSYLKPKDNMLVVLEEEGGDINQVEILTVNRNTICSVIEEDNPQHVNSWSMDPINDKLIGNKSGPAANLRCPDNLKMIAIEFASFGDPFGACGNFAFGECNSPLSKQVVEQHCLQKPSCTVPVNKDLFMQKNDICPKVSTKTLAIQALCA